MPNPTATTYCPQCGAINEDHATHCHQCATALHDVPAPVRPPRPFHLRTFGIAAATATILLVLARVVGLTFSLSVLAPEASISDHLRQIDTLQRDGVIERVDAESLRRQLEREHELREKLEADRLPTDEALSARERLPDKDQASVIGTGGLLGLVPPLAAMLLGAVVAVAVGRARRVLEVLAGVAIAAAIQIGTWMFAADFALGAILDGRTVLPRSFDGPPVMLLGMTVVLGLCGAAGVAAGLPRVIELFTGKAVCVRCDHRIALRPHAPTACPKCSEPLPERKGLRYRAGDDFLAELGPAANGDADRELLCLRCAKTYRGACPTHPHEPLLDPTRDEVRFQLLDLDNQAGTRRFVQWTQAGLGVDATRPVRKPVGPLLCIPCAKTVDGDQCPHHPDEPLVDPSRDDVRFRLLELDSEAGTQRYVQWTQAGLGIDAARSVDAPTGPLLCMQCAKTIDGDRCPRHPDEPLLDPSREDVRLELIAADDRARGRMGTAVIVVAMFAAMAASFGMRLLTDDGSTSIMVFAGVLIALTTVGRVFVPRLAPPRFSQWTGEGQVDLDEVGMGAEATIFAPLRRAWAEMKAEALVLAIVVAAGAGIGAGVGFALDVTVGGLALLGGVVAMIGLGVVWRVRGEVRKARQAVDAVRSEWNDPYTR